jgi:hypothetical protein
MQATTAGTAAMRPYVNKFGSASGRADTEIGLGVTASMNQRIPLLAPHKKQRFVTIPMVAIPMLHPVLNPIGPPNWAIPALIQAPDAAIFGPRAAQHRRTRMR